MDDDKKRQAFEAAYEAEVRRLKLLHGNAGFDGLVLTRNPDGNYVVGLVQAAWWGWKTAGMTAS